MLTIGSSVVGGGTSMDDRYDTKEDVINMNMKIEVVDSKNENEHEHPLADDGWKKGHRTRHNPHLHRSREVVEIDC